MTDFEARARFIWKEDIILDRALAAAKSMKLRVSDLDRKNHSFQAGSQWWGAYQLDVSVDSKFLTHLVVKANTLKFGYQRQLQYHTAVFLGLVKNPPSSNEGVRPATEPPPFDMNDYRHDDWGWSEDDVPDQGRVVSGGGGVAAEAVDAYLDPVAYLAYFNHEPNDKWTYESKVAALNARFEHVMHLKVVQDRMAVAQNKLRAQYARSNNIPI